MVTMFYKKQKQKQKKSTFTYITKQAG